MRHKITAKRGGDRINYIMMLDASAAVDGEPFTSLKEAVRSFLRAVVDNDSVRENLKLSIVLFGGGATAKSEVVVKTLLPNENMVDELKIIGGETDFAQPMRSAYEIASEAADSFDSTFLYLMTAGSALFPSSPISLLAPSPV